MWRRPLPLVVGMLAVLVGCRREPPGPSALPSGAIGTSVGTAAATVSPAPPAPASDLIALYSADLRGRVSPDPGTGNQGGLAQRATLVDRIRLKSGTVVQLDAGDFLPGKADEPIPPAPYAPERRAPIVLTSYGRMGIDALTLGERDLAPGPERLKTALKAAKLSVVAANLLDKRGERPFPCDEIIQAGGHVVGVFGILDVGAEGAATLTRVGVHTSDAVEAARTSARSLRTRGAQLVVGLFHLTGGLARAKEILTSASGSDIDIVILGHAGDSLAPGTITLVGKTRVVTTSPFGATVGRLDVRGLHAGGDPQIDDHLLTVTQAIPPHPGVALVERVEIEHVHADERQAAAAARRKHGQKEPPPPGETWTYGSNGSCQMCHEPQFQQWQTTDHAQALSTLEKNKHNLDPACLGCHMTGYLQPGGTQSLATVTTYFANVGCESCHGPSAEHVRSLDKKKGTSRTVGAEVCLGCHTNDQNIGPFDQAAALKSILGPGHGAPVPKPHPG